MGITPLSPSLTGTQWLLKDYVKIRLIRVAKRKGSSACHIPSHTKTRYCLLLSSLFLILWKPCMVQGELDTHSFLHSSNKYSLLTKKVFVAVKILGSSSPAFF